ncbi:MAG: decarboxylating 6-phosphogluconate dehydrogenase [Sphingobacteriales bacterium]|nr:decarboxylating 6-phosphogluconate dehydrogenase [Sphingobacteriales bacterium]
MQTALIGLGKMGYPLAFNIAREHEVIAFDVNETLRKNITAEGISTADSLELLIQSLKGRRVIWLMVPAGKIVDEIIMQLIPLLKADDIVIDGGNSFFKDSVRRGELLAQHKIHYLDCGTSGGTSGARNGVCAMIGGDKEAFDYCEPLFKSIALPNGYLYCGNSGSGHFTKMVHNGIEYGMMQSIAEGFAMMHASEYDFNLKEVAELWNQGSVIRSWLIELTANAFLKDAKLDKIKGIAHSSGEAQWMVDTAKDMNMEVPVIDLSLQLRYASLQKETYALDQRRFEHLPRLHLSMGVLLN